MIDPRSADTITPDVHRRVDWQKVLPDTLVLDRAVLRNSYASLTPREREVMALVVAGLLNKQVGGELDISEITVKAHRGSAMRKMKARSLARLVEMAARLGVSPPRPASH